MGKDDGVLWALVRDVPDVESAYELGIHVRVGKYSGFVARLFGSL